MDIHLNATRKLEARTFAAAFSCPASCSQNFFVRDVAAKVGMPMFVGDCNASMFMDFVLS